MNMKTEYIGPCNGGGQLWLRTDGIKYVLERHLTTNDVVEIATERDADKIARLALAWQPKPRQRENRADLNDETYQSSDDVL